MKTVLQKIMWIAGLLAGSASFAQPALNGVWIASLEVAPGQAIAVHFTLAQDAANNWTAILDSPDTGAIKNVPASKVSFDGSRLNVAVDALSGSYSGVLQDGAFIGEWTQPGATLAMNLAPYQAAVLSEEAIALLLGPWHGKLQMPGLQPNIVFQFARNDAGEVTGFMQQIDSAQARQAMADISLDDDKLFFRLPALGAEYAATLIDGGFQGSMKQGPQTVKLDVIKGEYRPE